MMRKWKKSSTVFLLSILLVCGGGNAQNAVAEVSDKEEVTEQVMEEAPQTETEANKKEAVTFTDDLGREVTVKDPKRVACLIGSFADVYLLAGGEVVATANDAWETLQLDLGEDVVNLGSIIEPDIEKLLAAEPDFVIASTNTDSNLEMEELLTSAGITVAYFDVTNFEDYLHMLEICTEITNRPDLYEENGLKVQEQIEKVKQRVDETVHPKVLFLRASVNNIKAKGSEDSVGSEILKDLGCINIADEEGSLLDDLSMEAIIEKDPDYIFVTVQGYDEDAVMQKVEETLTSNPAWASLRAVSEGKYYVVDKRLYNLKPNEKWGEAYEKMADILYSEEK